MEQGYLIADTPIRSLNTRSYPIKGVNQPHINVSVNIKIAVLDATMPNLRTSSGVSLVSLIFYIFLGTKIAVL
jgi:hypothetical protein